MWNGLNIMKRSLNARKGRRQKPPPSPNELAAFLRPLYTQFLKNLGYESTPTPSEEQAGALLAVMHKRAVQFGVPLDTRLSDKAFRLGFSEGLVCYLFYKLFGWALGYPGIAEVYVIFGYPTAQYPKIEVVLEELLDMTLFINIFNDVISNHIHNRALCEQKEPLDVVEEVKTEVEDCARRIEAILNGTGIYAQSWEAHMRHIAMHMTNPRYKLADLGLGKKHPFPERLFVQSAASRRDSGKQLDVENKERTTR
ncbi:hypothetical protein DL765_009793 [Monosporascus sp. GIB2]|nr:hypothetical protein DL765_009793 [Monosporascus sp. GIB2]